MAEKKSPAPKSAPKKSTAKSGTAKSATPAASTAQQTAGSVVGKVSGIAQIHWVAGLVVAVVLSHIFALIAIAVTNQWIMLVLLSILALIVAVAVGFAVRLTSSESTNQTFLAAFVTAGLGVHVVVRISAQGYDDFAFDMVNAYNSSPLGGYVIFFGLVAALVATVARRK